MFGFSFGFGYRQQIQSDYLIEYNYKFKNIGNGGSKYNGILNSGGYLSSTLEYPTPTFDVTNIKQIVYGTYEYPYIKTVNVENVTSYNIPDTYINNIMMFDSFLTETEYNAIKLNPSLFSRERANTFPAVFPAPFLVGGYPSNLKEWYPCSEYNYDYIRDAISMTKQYTVNATDNWKWYYSSSPHGIQAIKYNKDDRTLSSFYDTFGIPINNEKDYIDTQWIPKYNEIWEIEFELYFTDTDNYNVSGVLKDDADADTTYFNIGEITSNRVYTRLGDTYNISSSFSNGWHTLLVKYNGIDTLETYVDGVLINTIINTYTNDFKTFFLGWSNVGNGSETFYKNLKIKGT